MPLDYNEDLKEVRMLEQMQKTEEKEEKLELFNKYMNNKYEATWNSIKEYKWDLFNELIDDFIYYLSRDLSENEYLSECEEEDGTSSYESRLKTDYYIIADRIRHKRADKVEEEIEKEKGKFIKMESFLVNIALSANIYENESSKDIRQQIFNHCTKLKYIDKLIVANLPDSYLTNR